MKYSDIGVDPRLIRKVYLQRTPNLIMLIWLSKSSQMLLIFRFSSASNFLQKSQIKPRKYSCSSTIFEPQAFLNPHEFNEMGLRQLNLIKNCMNEAEKFLNLPISITIFKYHYNPALAIFLFFSYFQANLSLGFLYIPFL